MSYFMQTDAMCDVHGYTCICDVLGYTRICDVLIYTRISSSFMAENDNP